MRLLEGRVALVTGAGGGIGRGIALRFAQEGAEVALHCRTAVEPAREVADRIAGLGGRAVVLRGDLTDDGVCARVVREAAEWGGGRLDALVNNAGVQPVRELAGMMPTSGGPSWTPICRACSPAHRPPRRSCGNTAAAA